MNALRSKLLLAAAVSISGALALQSCATVSDGWWAVHNNDAARLKNILGQPNHGGEKLDQLMYEAAQGCRSCVLELLAAGAPPTGLGEAALRGQEQIARILIQHGADVEPALSWLEKGRSIQRYAAEYQAGIDMVKKIQSEGAQSSLAERPATPTAPALARHPDLTPSFQSALHPDDYALIVGVEKYDDLPAATYAENDAEAAGAFVRAMGVPVRNVATLVGARATRSGLAKQLEGWLPNNVNKNSTVYFYYSGHGAPNPKDGQAYLVPIDGDPQYLDQTAYSLKRVYEKLGELKAKRVIVMLDSCFSGAGGRSVLAKGARPLVNNVDTGFNSAGGKIVVLTASGADQISGTNENNGHGLFTYHLLAGLNGAAADASGQVTIKSLYDYLKPKVMDDARRANREQTPQLQSIGTAADTLLREAPPSIR